MLDPADLPDVDPHEILSNWEILPMYFCGKCGVNARVSPGKGPKQKWACHVCLNVTADLMQFERIGPQRLPDLSDEQLVALAETVCERFAGVFGRQSTPGSPPYYRSTNGRRRQIWELVVIAFEELLLTPIDDAVSGIEEEMPEFVGENI